MKFFDLVLRRPVEQIVRRDYDKLYKKIDKLHDIENRVELLGMLGETESRLIAMEQTPMNGFDKKKMSDLITDDLKRVDLVLENIKTGTIRSKFSI